MSVESLVVERPDLGTLRVTGPDRQTWLQGVVTCDLRGLEPGRGAYGLVLARNGHILTDTTVVVAEAAVYVSVHRERLDPVREHLDRLLVMEDAELEACTEAHAWAMAFGAATPRWEHPAATVRWPGIEGVAVVAPAGALVAPELAGPAEWQRLRIEVGFPAFGVDFDSSHTVHEASLEQRAVSTTKGCYVGQDVVARQQSRGRSPTRLVWLTLGSDAPPAVGAEVVVGADARAAGKVTSATFSPRLGRALAIARVASAHAGDGSRVRIDEVDARVSEVAPFAAD